MNTQVDDAGGFVRLVDKYEWVVSWKDDAIYFEQDNFSYTIQHYSQKPCSKEIDQLTFAYLVLDKHEKGKPFKDSINEVSYGNY